MKKALFIFALVSLFTAPTAEARGPRVAPPPPTERQLADARWIKLKVGRCVARTKANNQKLSDGGELMGINFPKEEEYERICLAIISMR